MPPINTKESLTVLAALTDLAPFLSPLKATILLIADVIESVADNKNQCAYLVARCAELCLNVHELCSDSTKLPNHYLKPFEEFGRYVDYNFGMVRVLRMISRTLDKILSAVQRLSKITPLRRFLQRQEISESIKENHRSIDCCVELFNVCSFASDALPPFGVNYHVVRSK
jgi:hypothetical protein